MIEIFKSTKLFKAYLCILIAISAAQGIFFINLNSKYASIINAIGKRTFNSISQYIMGLLLLASSIAIFRALQSYLITIMSSEVGYTLRKKSAWHILNIHMSITHGMNTADTQYRMDGDIRKISQWVEQLSGLVVSGVLFITVIIMLLRENIMLTLFAYAAIPIIIAFSIGASSKMKKIQRKQRKAFSNAQQRVLSIFGAFTTVKLYNMKTYAYKAYKHDMDTAVYATIKNEKVQAILMSINAFCFFIPTGVILVYGGMSVIDGSMTIGKMWAFTNLTWLINGPLMNLPSSIKAGREATVSIERINEIFEMNKERKSGTMCRPALHLTNAISIHNLTFGYNDNKIVLKNINLKMKVGERIALVGPSGSGKSTILMLIAGLYTASERKISILGNSIANWHVKMLREQISMVTQETFLFPGTIRENITCGRQCSDDKILSACRAAHIMDYIHSLSNGLNTVLDENGSNLSGGQRQRISIARAIIRDTPILILDEATSALDSKTQHDIIETLKTLIVGKTTIIVTHRPAVLALVDTIYCMYEGSIIENGTHDELIAQKGFYTAMMQREMLGG